MTWHLRAACAEPDIDPDWFFPRRGERKTARQALATCQRCPVRIACLEAALDEEEPRNVHGIRGGHTASERAAMIRKRTTT